MARSLKRSVGFASFGVPVVLAVVLSACGDDESGATGTVVEIKPSTFVVAPTSVADGSAGGSAPTGSGGGSAGETYEIERGDSLSAIASDYGITIDAIANFNNWSDGSRHLLVPGDTIRIPPGADVPSADDNEATDTTEEDANADSGDGGSNTADGDSADADLCPDGSRQGSYTIEEGDYPAKIADALNTTVDQLDEANANTPGYGAFFAGLEIVVPCSGESSDTTG